MKMKNLIAYAMLALGVVATPFAGRAAVSGGDIYSVDLSTEYNGVIPKPGEKLTIGELVTVRIRLVNKDETATGKPTEWRFAPNWPSGETKPEESVFGPQFGLMLGGQQVFADYMGSKQVPIGTEKKNNFTDLYFQYRVKSGDLALPARFMSTKGEPVSSDSDATDYAIRYCNFNGIYWKLSNNNGDICIFHFCDENLSPDPDPSYEAGKPQRYITGTELGINIKTVDFDTEYFKEASLPGVDDGIWRQLYVGLTTALPSLPTVKVDGFADEATTMYVWVDNEDNANPIAQVLPSDDPIWVPDDNNPDQEHKNPPRCVIKVPIIKDASSATFKLQGHREGTVKVKMSSSRDLYYYQSGDVITNWVERTVSVVPAPDPFVMVETLNPQGDAQTEFNCTANYKDFVGKFKITLSLPPTNKVTVTLAPDWADVIPEAVENRRIGLSKSGDKADMPWLDRDLSVDFEAGQTVQTLYIYALDRTTDHKGKVTFTPSVSDTDLYTGTPVAGSLVVNAATPVVVRPESGEELDTAILKEPYTLFFEVTDGYRCMNTNKGWKIEYKCSAVGDTKSHTVSAEMETGTGMLTADIKFTKQCVNEKFQARVKDPNGEYSAWRTYTITVEEGCSVRVTYDRTGSYAENSAATAKLTFELSQTSGDDLYLFLEPLNEAASNHVETAQLAKAGSRNGIEVPAGETQGRGEANITLLDGGYGSDYNPKFKIVVCNEEEYSADAVQDGWAGSCTISITNVVPVIRSASVGGDDIDKSGGIAAPVALGVKKAFTLTVNEPGSKDKEATGDDAFLTQWKFGAGNWIDMKGNPDKVAVTNEFGSSGDQLVKVRCQDKDMRKLGLWSEEFTFTVPVMETPKVVITPVQDRRQYYEDETGADYAFNVTLTIPPYLTNSAQRLNVLLRKELLGDASQYSADDLVFSKTNVTFTASRGDVGTFYLKQLDGTIESASSGFRIIAEVVNDGPGGVDGDGKTWDNGELEVNILNREPKILLPGEQLMKDDKPVPTPTQVGKVNKLVWAINDVNADTNRMTVSFMTNEGEEWTYTAGVNVDSAMKGTHEWTFSSTGEKSITMTVTDKDGGSVSRTWTYTIEVSKSMTTVPHGPAGGYGTANSKRYRTAAGLGEGRVWAKNLASLDGFKALYNCGVSRTWDVFAYGYKVGDVDDGVNLHKVDGTLGYYTNRDTPIDEFGNPLSTNATANATAYAYVAKTDRNGQEVDSFLYTWLQISSKDQDNASLVDEILGGAVQPEYTEVKDTGVSVVLPGELKSEEKTYEETMLEAVFSHEYLATDNMGDINQDGIPDIYVDKYGFGVVDTTSGKMIGDDLTRITAVTTDETGAEKPGAGNSDNDFLPTTGFSAYSTLIPGLPDSWTIGTPFTAKTEIRGYGEALNDAPFKSWVGISGVKPERRYTDPRVDPRSTLDGLDPNGSGEPVEYYAWLAFAARNGIADPTNEANKAAWELWSPECPSDPMLADTDDDGFLDGYEYYFWYRAHVGYVENGVHRYLTGRAYDPRNPGEGRFISAEEIEKLMNPGEAFGDASSAKLRDTDNDGLTDLLEFEIGTNPFDFDTDGDGLPDGFEIMLCGTDPLLAETTPGISDAMRNFDGDAMAFTTPFLEAEGFVVPQPLVVNTFVSFALVDPDGDTDGVQWYVGRTAPTNIVPGAAEFTGTSFQLVGDTNVTYVTTLANLPVVDGRLAADLSKEALWTAVSLESLTNALPCLTNLIAIVDNGDGTATTNRTDYIRFMPSLLTAGLEVTNVTEGVKFHALEFAKDVKGVNTAWVYGRSVNALTTGENLANMGGFGMLTIGRYQDAPAGLAIAALPERDDDVAYIHHFVYQEFGFDPRTAWNANTPLAPRWGKTVKTGEEETEETETVANVFLANYGYAGISTRTREYTLYDEFLVMSFFLNNGKLSLADVTPTQSFPWEKIWSKFTTNGQGPNEPNWEEDNEHFKGRTAETKSADNGADTDRDGVPDGWELYVMAGPKLLDEETKELRYNLVAPYNDGFYSSFGPFVADAAKVSMTDNTATGGRSSTGGDGDGLTELQEYAGTDSCAYYADENQLGADGEPYAYSTTIVRPAEHAAWLNKFFPTDPWNTDTDGDGLSDGKEAGTFKYGKPVDDGKLTCIPGGGLNPLSVDTDMDGLPDPWEKQFEGHAIYDREDAQKPKDKDGNTVEDGNPLQGLCDGMDGTVFDAYTSPHIDTARMSGDTLSSETMVVSLNGVAQVVDRDYDHDGLENWQEYLTGAMRAWRYDDPVTEWSYIPDSAYFNPMTGEFDLAAAMAYTGISNPNEFWYRTLFDRSSKWYNPHFVTGTSPSSQYFSRVTNGWDMVFSESGTYYMFPDRVNGDMLKQIWGIDYYDTPAGPKKYACTSPVVADTDRDGMDDYYELFHGLNPLLGLPDVLSASDGPYDVVYDAWGGQRISAINPMANPWLMGIPGNGVYDFTVHPWLNGIVNVDPDGDDIRNQDEAIMPLVAPSTSWYHTDPTPLWMTDSSYDGSLVWRFYRMPICLGKVPVPESIVFDTDGDGTPEEISLVDRDGFGPDMLGWCIYPFFPDYWYLALPGAANWMYSFEENEGYDSDHDSASDNEELQGKFRNKTDPQDADSPRRRQAMYFQGPENPSALQSMPFVKELYPRAHMGYPDDMSFLQYTVECWVRPESVADATVIERTSFSDPSHVADERYVRRNFMIGIRNGKWYTAFDSNGTLDNSTVEVEGKTDAQVGEWAYVVATYDANRLTLYVNGNEDGYVLSNLKPEYGSAAVIVYPAGTSVETTNGVISSGESLAALEGEAHRYWMDAEYTLHAFLIGASFANAPDGNHLDVTAGLGWGRYRSFFKGWVDEVRVWDGAQPADVIESNFSSRKRFTREDALENRSSFYNQWSTGKRRYAKDGDGKDLDVMPELRFHWAFDSIPGADNAAAVAQAPHGFLDGGKAPWSSPDGYRIPWWSGVVGAYGSVYEGGRNWVPWIPNTVTHLPRFDLTTIDSAYWSENYAGDEAGTYRFARTMEPVSKWMQLVRNMAILDTEFQTTGRRFWLSYNTGTNATSTLPSQLEFTGRHLNMVGDDLLPLGGAFARYVDRMWDDQGASSVWEQTGNDADNDGLPDWWQEYAEQNYREGVPEDVDITWSTVIWYEVGGVKRQMTAGEAYQRDLAKGVYLDANGKVQTGPTAYAQSAKSDGMIPDWWKELKKIDGEEALSDLDNDGLNNYVEYVASELLPFKLNLDPRMAKSDTKTLDYFRKIGKLYLGEMLTDHDQMEDHWERSLGNESVASTALWDALKDGEGDGWNNFAENRYNGYMMSTLAQLISHAVGDNEVLDAPIPSIKLKVRYNGNLSLVKKEGEDVDAHALVVRAFSRNDETGSYVLNPDAVWSVKPGETVEKEVYLGGWEDRVVRGTMAPGNVDLGTLDIKFAQVPQSDLYSWTDESGTHISGTYKEFKEALDKNPDIIQNIQNFEWLSLYAPANEYTSADRAVTVTRAKLTQRGDIAVYGEPVGTVDLTTGDFEFDMAAMNKLRVNYTYDGSKSPAAAWGYKEAIFKITYSATVPSAQQRVVDVSLAKADRGFVRGGDNSFEAFYDLDDNGEWNPGEPFGVANGVEIGWASRNVEIELSDMSAVTPRVKLWGAGGQKAGGQSSSGGQQEKTSATAQAADSDRGMRVGTDWTTKIPVTELKWVKDAYGRNEVVRYTTNAYDRLNRLSSAPNAKTHVKVVRYTVDNNQTFAASGFTPTVVMEKTFEQESRDFLHEGDFLTDGDLDLDWKNLYKELLLNRDVLGTNCKVTNVSYLITFDWDATAFRGQSDTNTVVSAFSTLVTRRFEVERTIPTPIQEKSTVTVFNKSRPTFTWKIDGEDEWAAWFGTTYTAFKVRVKDLTGKLVYDSGVRRLPAKDSLGQYSWTAPLYVGEVVPGTGVLFENLADYTWEVAVYNAKFSTDDLMTIQDNKLVTGNPFSKPSTFRMNVTELDASSSALAVRVCYVGPATWLENRIRVQAFESPDFTGDPVAAVTLDDVSEAALSPSSKTANAKLIGLPEGKYFLRAYIDTNGNGVHDDWESWGYLNERDQASKPGIFNPVALEASVNPSVANVRTVLIEDCDTDGDWFPDVWEAEQNGGVFDPEAIKPVTGDAELIGVNMNLDANLVKEMKGVSEALMTFKSLNGVSLMTGIAPAGVRSTANGFVVNSEVKSETLTIVGLSVDTANGRVLLKVGAETTANVDPTVASFLNVTVRRGASVTVKVEHAETPAGPWTELQGVGGTVTVEKAGADIEVKLNGELPAQGYFRAKIVEK